MGSRSTRHLTGQPGKTPVRATLSANLKLRKPRTQAYGLTLVELVMSMTIMAILMAGMGSAVMIASRAVDDGTSPAAKTSQAREALDRIMADVQFALDFSERTENAVTFTVPDRNGDALPETIRYAWSGVEGDPVTLEYNGGSVVTIAEDVHQFDLTYLWLTTGPPPPPPEVESEEMVLASHDVVIEGTVKQFNVRTICICAQYFRPSLPLNAASWSITRVKLHAASSDKPIHTSSVEIRSANAAEKPTSTTLEAVVVPEAGLPTEPLWVDVAFTSLAELDPSAGLCLVIAGLSHNKYTMAVTYDIDAPLMTPGTHFMHSYDQGASWSEPDDSRDMRFYVYGTVTTEGEPEWP